MKPDKTNKNYQLALAYLQQLRDVELQLSAVQKRKYLGCTYTSSEKQPTQDLQLRNLSCQDTTKILGFGEWKIPFITLKRNYNGY